MVRRSITAPRLQTARGSPIQAYLLIMAKGMLRGRCGPLLFGNLIVTLQPAPFYLVHLPVTISSTSLTEEITATLYFQG